MRQTIAIVAAVGITLLACKLGDSTPAGSCDRRTVTGWESCFDYPKSELQAGKSSCKDYEGKWADTPCEHASALGGCKLSTGITKWFFSGSKVSTAEDAKKECYDKWLEPSAK